MADVAPVYVPSRGRAGRCTTADRLEESGVPFRLVVEPRERGAYADRFGHDSLLALPADDPGLPSVRNWILRHAAESGLGWFWMLDDDVGRFHRVAGKRCVPCPAREALAGAQAEFTHRPDVAQAALEYQQFAWSCGGKPRLNSYCDVAVCVHAGRCRGLRFRDDVTLKLDRDFTLQVLSLGWSTYRTTRWAFDTPKNGSNPGGLAPLYATADYEAAASRRMCELWGPAICTPLVKRDGRPDVRINWAHFRPGASSA